MENLLNLIIFLILLALGYFAGTHAEKKHYQSIEQREDEYLNLPAVTLKNPGVDFSFSGLKTAVLLAVRELEQQGELGESDRADIAKSFEEAAVETLVAKSLRALDATGYSALVVAGGVGANLQLRAELEDKLGAKGAQVYYPRPELCTDNGAMVAFAGLQRFAAGQTNGHEVVARPRWALDQLPPL